MIFIDYSLDFFFKLTFSFEQDTVFVCDVSSINKKRQGPLYPYMFLSFASIPACNISHPPGTLFFGDLVLEASGIL